MSVSVCLCLGMYIRTYLSVYGSTSLCLCFYVCVSVSMCLCLYVSDFVSEYACMRRRVNMCVSLYVCLSIYVYVYALASFSVVVYVIIC